MADSKKNSVYLQYLIKVPIFCAKQQNTSNLKKRITLHNMSKGAKFTRGRKWKLIYKEKHGSKKEAISREYYIKKNRSLRKKIIENNKY